MEKEYAATYKFGNSTVHVVAPAPASEEKKKRILKEFHQTGYRAWRNRNKK